MITFRQSPYGAAVVVLDDEFNIVLDATVRPIRVKLGVNLAPLITNYGSDITVTDDAGIKVVWTEDGQTHIDEAGDLEVFE